MGKDLTKVKTTFFICNGGTCKKHDSENITRELRCAIKIAGKHETLHTIKTLCVGQCENAPVLFSHPNNIWYKNISISNIQELMQENSYEINALENFILFSQDKTTMEPSIEIVAKTRNEFSYHADPYLGTIYGASIYPWEHNAYPLLKEVFEKYRTSLKIKYRKKELYSKTFRIDYKDGIALIEGETSSEGIPCTLSATRGTEAFLNKISKMKLYKDTQRNVSGIYFANSKGILIEAEWSGELSLWNHVFENYVDISG